MAGMIRERSPSIKVAPELVCNIGFDQYRKNFASKEMLEGMTVDKQSKHLKLDDLVDGI